MNLAGLGMTVGKPLVSAIVPTKNSELTIGICLNSIMKQTYSNIEVIVVDNCSRDNTREIAEMFGARFVESETGMSGARNVGVKEAKGDVIVSIDSDMELTSVVLEKCVGEIDKGFDAVIIPEVSVGLGFWARCKALEKICYIGDETIEAARFFTKSAFERVGGYDPELLAGEDWDFNARIRKAGCRIGRIDAFIKHHEGRLSLRETVMKKYHYGKTLERYRKKHSEEANQQIRLLRQAYIRNWTKLVKDPVHASGMLFMKACEFAAGWVGSVE